MLKIVLLPEPSGRSAENLALIALNDTFGRAVESANRFTNPSTTSTAVPSVGESFFERKLPRTDGGDTGSRKENASKQSLGSVPTEPRPGTTTYNCGRAAGSAGRPRVAPALGQPHRLVVDYWRPRERALVLAGELGAFTVEFDAVASMVPPSGMSVSSAALRKRVRIDTAVFLDRPGSTSARRRRRWSTRCRLGGTNGDTRLQLSNSRPQL